MATDLYTRYFMFSNEHHVKLRELARKNGNMNPTLGQVMVSGNFKPYTKLTSDPSAYSKLYADARVVLCGDIRQVRYKAGDL